MPYFDYNATTPLLPAAREVWLRAHDEHWHNPSSPYRDAAKAKIRLDNARDQLAELVGAKSELLVFNSGATEGSHTILAYLAATSRASAPIAVNRTEHPCLLGAAQTYFGDRIVWLDTDENGGVRLEQVRGALANDDLAAVLVMAANNETGVLQPWSAIAELCRARRVPYVCDASQWLGKLPASGFAAVDWLIGAGHKFGGPKGVGFLKRAVQADGFRAQPGGEQEGGRRGGTENLPGIWAMTVALADAEQKKVFLETERLAWRQEFERSVLNAVLGTKVVGAEADRLWNTTSLIVPQGENHRWVTKLDKLGFQVSTGSACATGKEGPSHVLTALGYTAEQAKRALRISSGWETTRADWQALAAALTNVSATFGAEPSKVVPA